MNSYNRNIFTTHVLPELKSFYLSGINRPVPITPSLAKFAEWSENDLVSRVNITKYLCEYIKQNNLQSQSDKRHIVPDEKLKKLFRMTYEETKKLTYLNMQQYIARTCIKTEKPTKQNVRRKFTKYIHDIQNLNRTLCCCDCRIDVY